MAIEWHDIIEECDLCKLQILVKQACGRTLIILSEGWIIGHSGDDLIFLCSESCAKKWIENKNKLDN